MFRSLRLRLAIGNALFLVLLLTGLGLVGLQSYRTSVDRQATDELLRIADDYATIIAMDGPGAIPDHRDDPSDAAILVAVFADDGTVLGGSEPPAWLEPQPTPIADGSVDGDPVRFATSSVRLPDGSAAELVVARSLRRLAEAVDELWNTFLSGLVEVVVLSGLFGWWISGRMIRPVVRSYEAQRSFAADASHELRTPLTFIRAGVEVLAPAKPDLGAQVLGEIDYMASLTDRLLLLARAEDGRIRFEPKAFDLTEVCRASVDRGRGALGIDLAVRGDGTQETLTALGDPVLTATILDALIENVARYGGASAELHCGNGGTTVTVAVADRGRGIDGDVERLFDRFARIETSRDRDSGGAGLGLPLARSLARAQGGDVRLSPTPGGGLTATLELPVG